MNKVLKRCNKAYCSAKGANVFPLCAIWGHAYRQREKNKVEKMNKNIYREISKKSVILQQFKIVKKECYEEFIYN